MNRKIKIAILDTGIAPEYANRYLNTKIIKNFKLIESKNHIEFEECKLGDINGHGTACVSVINRLCKEVEYISVQLLNDKGKSNIQRLIAALTFMKYIDVDIINVSLSSNNENYIEEMDYLIKNLKNQKKYVLAAKSNDRAVSIPAQLHNSYGVQSHKSKCGTYFWYKKDQDIQLTCDGTPCMIPSYCQVPFLGGNSKATAQMTGIIAAHLFEGHSFNTL